MDELNAVQLWGLSPFIDLYTVARGLDNTSHESSYERPPAASNAMLPLRLLQVRKGAPCFPLEQQCWLMLHPDEHLSDAPHL